MLASSGSFGSGLTKNVLVQVSFQNLVSVVLVGWWYQVLVPASKTMDFGSHEGRDPYTHSRSQYNMYCCIIYNVYSVKYLHTLQYTTYDESTLYIPCNTIHDCTMCKRGEGPRTLTKAYIYTGKMPCTLYRANMRTKVQTNKRKV